MKRILIGILIAFAVLILIFATIIFINIRDRHSGYELDLKLPEKNTPVSGKQLQVGLAKVPITPDIQDTWTDSDNNSRYEPDKGDSYIDKNGNGKFDAYWLAGFQNSRPATGVHDDIWARAILWDDGNLRVALIVLDAIGFFHDDVITARRMIAEKDLDIDHVIIATTHNHEVPDLMGLWGPEIYKSGVNETYMEMVKDKIVQVTTQAFSNLRPAVIKVSKIDSTAADLVRDSRPPFILDDAIHMMQFCDPDTDTPFGMLLNWGNHPETLGSKNLLITSDFCHYWLKGIEEGILYDNEEIKPGIGGIAVFANGAIGGLMTTLGCETYDPWLNIKIKKDSFEKARAQGYRLSEMVLDKIEAGQWEVIKDPSMKLRAKTFLFEMENTNFLLGGILGIFDRGFIKFKYLRSEVNLLTLGPAWILTLPGEVNPEIVNGGIEVPEGADFPGEPLEAPALRQLMSGRYNFVIGLANDEVGYIMPKTHWDVEKPYTYGATRKFYGEINSLGPEAGPTMYNVAKDIIEDIDEIGN